MGDGALTSASWCGLKEARQKHSMLCTFSPNTKAEWILFQLRDHNPSPDTAHENPDFPPLETYM